MRAVLVERSTRNLLVAWGGTRELFRVMVFLWRRTDEISQSLPPKKNINNNKTAASQQNADDCSIHCQPFVQPTKNDIFVSDIEPKLAPNCGRCRMNTTSSGNRKMQTHALHVFKIEIFLDDILFEKQTCTVIHKTQHQQEMGTHIHCFEISTTLVKIQIISRTCQGAFVFSTKRPKVILRSLCNQYDSG